MIRWSNIEIKEKFMKKGYFSEYLPPEFTLDNSYDVFISAISQKNDFVEPLSFNMSRFSEDGRRRIIYIPELASYVAAVKYMKDYDLVNDLISVANDAHSYSPLLQNNGDVTRHERDYCINGLTLDPNDQEAMKLKYIPNVIDKVKRSKGAKGILAVDISNFYPSIYTHLFPSIKLGYEQAEAQYKAFRANQSDTSISDDYKKYKELDEKTRNMNGGRTNGLLPGTLISQFLAEALLSRVDKEIEAQGISFVRYVDDFEIFIYDESEIVKVQNSIVEILKKYFLALNNEKTKFIKFPYYIVQDLERIYSNYTKRKIEPDELMKMFNTFFELEANGTKGAIRFLVKSLDDAFQCSNNELYSTYLLDVLVNDERSLVQVCQLMIKEKNKLRFKDEDIQIIQDLLLKNIDNNNHLETIWLLYLRLRLRKKKLTTKIMNLIVESGNVLAIILLLEETYAYIPTKTIEKCKSMDVSWILCYQLYLHDYISKSEFIQKSRINNNSAFYSTLKNNNFSFYRKQI